MIEAFIYFNLSFLVRMILIFTVMMKYYHWKKKDVGPIWKTIAGIFFVADIIYNWAMTLYFFDKPRVWDETVTNRMARYLKEETGFKLGFAKVMRKLLNYSDPDHL